MNIKPKLNYSIEGYGQLDKDKKYKTTIATNQPDYDKDGLIFVEPNEDLRIEFLLNKDEYTVISKLKPGVRHTF